MCSPSFIKSIAAHLTSTELSESLSDFTDRDTFTVTVGNILETFDIPSTIHEYVSYFICDACTSALCTIFLCQEILLK